MQSGWWQRFKAAVSCRQDLSYAVHTIPAAAMNSSCATLLPALQQLLVVLLLLLQRGTAAPAAGEVPKQSAVQLHKQSKAVLQLTRVVDVSPQLQPASCSCSWHTGASLWAVRVTVMHPPWPVVTLPLSQDLHYGFQALYACCGPGPYMACLLRCNLCMCWTQ